MDCREILWEYDMMRRWGVIMPEVSLSARRGMSKDNQKNSYFTHELLAYHYKKYAAWETRMSRCFTSKRWDIMALNLSRWMISGRKYYRACLETNLENVAAFSLLTLIAYRMHVTPSEKSYESETMLYMTNDIFWARRAMSKSILLEI